MNLHIYMDLHKYIWICAGAHRGVNSMWDLLELELQEVVSCNVCVGTELESSARIVYTFNH